MYVCNSASTRLCLFVLQRQYSIMFVRYETMAKHLHSIAEFLDAPSLENFMFRDRKSDFRRLNPRHREGLERTLGAFKAWCWTRCQTWFSWKRQHEVLRAGSRSERCLSA